MYAVFIYAYNDVLYVTVYFSVFSLCVYAYYLYCGCLLL